MPAARVPRRLGRAHGAPGGGRGPYRLGPVSHNAKSNTGITAPRCRASRVQAHCQRTSIRGCQVLPASSSVPQQGCPLLQRKANQLALSSCAAGGAVFRRDLWASTGVTGGEICLGSCSAALDRPEGVVQRSVKRTRRTAGCTFYWSGNGSGEPSRSDDRSKLGG